MTEKYEHKNFTRLCEIENASPRGYIVRLPIYVQGTRDALIQFSTRANPAPNAAVYEFCEFARAVHIGLALKWVLILSYFLVPQVIGGWGNTRLIIRRKRGYEDLADVTIDDALAVDQPTKFVIEITTGAPRGPTKWRRSEVDKY